MRVQQLPAAVVRSLAWRRRELGNCSSQAPAPSSLPFQQQRASLGQSLQRTGRGQSQGAQSPHPPRPLPSSGRGGDQGPGALLPSRPDRKARQAPPFPSGASSPPHSLRPLPFPTWHMEPAHRNYRRLRPDTSGRRAL